MVLRLDFCDDTTTHDLGMQLFVLHSEMILLQRRTAAASATAGTATTIEEATLGYARTSVAKAAIDNVRKIATLTARERAIPTRQ